MRSSGGAAMSRAGTVAAAALAATLLAGTAQAQQAGRYGGGLIEFLVTGEARGVRPQAYRANPVGYGDGTLPGHPDAYGYGGPGSPDPYANPYAGDPMPDPAPRRPQTRLAALQQTGPAEAQAIARAPDPQFARQVVDYPGHRPAGSIVVDTTAKFLYLVQPGGRAIRYGIGVGRPGFVWSGTKTISAKREWPDWTPPPEMLRRRPDLPRHMQGGPANPLGARARSISAPRSTASTAPTSRTRSARTSPPAASG